MNAGSRDSQGRFVKGNPGGGRPRQNHNVRDLARTFTAEAIATLVSIMKDEDMDAGPRVRAAEALLDRGWGKPSQPIESGDGNGFSLTLYLGGK